MLTMLPSSPCAKKVLERFGIEKYDWDYNRAGAFVSFTYQEQYYRFDHTVQKAQDNDIGLTYGSDCFAQIVLALEDLARIVERGIYDLQSWVAGMKCLPEATLLPWFYEYLGFTKAPTAKSEIDAQFKVMAKIMHPDTGGSNEKFVRLQEAKKLADESIACHPDLYRKSIWTSSCQIRRPLCFILLVPLVCPVPCPRSAVPIVIFLP